MTSRSPTLLRGPYPNLAQDITLAAVSGLTATTYTQDGIHMRTVFTLASVQVTMADGTSHLSYGSLKLCDFPTGFLFRQGGCFDLTALRSVGGATGLNTGAALVISLGSAAADNGATLTGNEVSFIASTGTTLSSFVAAASTTSSSPATTLLGTASTAVSLYFNAAANSSETTTTGADTLTLSGTFLLDWTIVGKTGQ